MSGDPRPIRFYAPSPGLEPCPGCKKIPDTPGYRITVPGEWYSWHAECFPGLEGSANHVKDALASAVERAQQKIASRDARVRISDEGREARRRKKCPVCEERHFAPWDGSCLI